MDTFSDALSLLVAISKTLLEAAQNAKESSEECAAIYEAVMSLSEALQHSDSDSMPERPMLIARLEKMAGTLNASIDLIRSPQKMPLLDQPLHGTRVKEKLNLALEELFDIMAQENQTMVTIGAQSNQTRPATPQPPVTRSGLRVSTRTTVTCRSTGLAPSETSVTTTKDYTSLLDALKPIVQRKSEAGPSSLARSQQREPNTYNIHPRVRDHGYGEASTPLFRAKGTLQIGRHSSSGPLSTGLSDPAPPLPPALPVNDGESTIGPPPSCPQGEVPISLPHEDRAIICNTQVHAFTHPTDEQGKSVASASKTLTSNLPRDIVQSYQVDVLMPTSASDYFIIQNIGVGYCSKNSQTQHCVRILSSILCDCWRIIQHEHFIPADESNRRAEAVYKATILLSRFIQCTASSEDTVQTQRHISRQHAMDILGLIHTIIETVPKDSRRDFVFWRYMNQIRVMLCEYSCHIPRTMLLTGVRRREDFVPRTGSYGDVFQGTFNGQTVAIKRFRIFKGSSGETTADIVKSHCRELAIQCSLRHPNICGLIGVIKDDFSGKVGFCGVAPWVPYGSILGFLRLRGFSSAKVHHLLVEIAEGLRYLHQEGFAHGDLHPGNILVDGEEHVKLSDFGISNIANVELSIGSSRPGAERYMAPEICDPDRFSLSHIRHTEKSDVYSVGHLCWKIFTGQDPFATARSSAQRVKAIVDGQLPDRPIDAGPRHISDGLWAIMQECWRRKPEDRPSSADLPRRFQSLRDQLSESQIQ